MFLKKQDRQGVRTAADLDRRYNIKKVEGVASDSLKVAISANTAAEESKKVASSAQTEVSDKVSKTDNSQVVKMVNEATEKITLKNRLILNSDKFGMDEDGSIHASGGDIAGFDFDGDGLRKIHTETLEGQSLIQRKVEVSPGAVTASETGLTAGIPAYTKTTKISNGALEVSISDLISGLLGKNLSFMTVKINGTTYNLFIDPDTLSIVVKKDE